MLLKLIPAGVFLGFLLLTISHGVFSSYLPIAAAQITLSPYFVGALSSVYFFGLLIGNMWIERAISRYGQSRVFTLLVSVLMLSELALALLPYISVWLVLRLLMGVAMGGAMIVVELYALSVAENKRRYALMMYFIALYGGMMLGATCILGLADRVSMIVCCCVTVVFQILSNMSTNLAKPIEVHVQESGDTGGYWEILKSLYSSFVVIFVGGVLVGSAAAHIAPFGRAMHYSVSYVSLMVALTLGGGAVFAMPSAALAQWQGDIRTVLILLILGMLCDLFHLMGPCTEGLWSLLMIFCSIGSVYPLYMLGISRTARRARSGADFIKYAAVAGTVFSIGAVCGPMASALVIDFWEKGLFAFNGVMRLALFVFIFILEGAKRERSAVVSQVGTGGQKVGFDALNVGSAPLFQGVLQRTRFNKKKKRLTK